ncbi:hypothetical protein [Haladaptatus sp. NG-SE-30]
MGLTESLAGVAIWLFTLAVAALVLDLFGLFPVQLETTITLLAFGGVLTVLVQSFLAYFGDEPLL